MLNFVDCCVRVSVGKRRRTSRHVVHKLSVRQRLNDADRCCHPSWDRFFLAILAV